jgi:hypothetical protein
MLSAMHPFERYRTPVEAVSPVRDAAAIELWDLRGSPGRDDARVFDGAVEARQFAWELSALLSHAVYHVSRLGRVARPTTRAGRPRGLAWLHVRARSHGHCQRHLLP